MTDKNFGSGIKLTHNWDIDVDNTGDVATVSGSEELQKDSSMLSSITLEKQLGKSIQSRLNSNSMKDIELLVRRTLLSDERIKRVVNVEAWSPENTIDLIEIEAEVIADSSQKYDLIFEVNI